MAAAALLVALLSGCGYFAAGTWEDDPKNWGRAFGTVKPDDVVVVHSRYSRFPHFTFEREYYFQLAPHPLITRQLFEEDARLVRVAPDDTWTRPSTAPAWFAPRRMSDYDAWRLANRHAHEFCALVDRKTGEIFITEMQL